MKPDTHIDEQTLQVMHQCSTGSLNGTLRFPEVLARLEPIGCEQYFVDLRRKEKTYYFHTPRSHSEALPLNLKAPGKSFVTADIVAALRASQSGQIDYLTFLDRIVAAGCVGYFVYIIGRRARYLGRNGESYLEVMPSE